MADIIRPRPRVFRPRAPAVIGDIDLGKPVTVTPSTKNIFARVSGRATAKNNLSLAPIITPNSYTLSFPQSADEEIATLSVTNTPLTAITIVSGDSGNPSLSPPGYFAVYPATQNLRTSETAGAVLPPAGTYTLGINAANSFGTGPTTNIQVAIAAEGVPVINNGSFSLALPLTSGEAVGTNTASNNPTSWNITAVSGDGASTSDFAINSSGAITTTRNSVSDITTTGTITITVTATNITGI